MADNKVTILTIAGGKVPALFKKYMDELMRNMRDPNTPAEAAREFTFKFVVKPHKDRTMAKFELKHSSKLPTIEPLAGSMFLSEAGNELEAFTHDPRQDVLPWETGPSKATPPKQ